MLTKVSMLLAIAGLGGVLIAGCGKQTNGNVATAVSQDSEESISSAANQSIYLSNTNSSQLSVSGYGAESMTPSSCPVVTRSIDSSGNPVTGTITLDFDGGCIPAYTNVIVSGMITMTVAKFSDGTVVTATTFDADNAIVLSRWDGASLYLSGMTDVLTTGSKPGLVITRTVGINETRQAFTAIGREVLHQDIALGFTAQDTLSQSTPPVTITQRVLNGSGTIDHLLLKVLASITASDLTYQQGSCHPVDGTITEVLTSDVTGRLIGTYTLSFTPTGATLNGKSINLNPCD